ncbi:MAG: GNAT family N-acetyltransferase [Butyrivibrio sp.]
METITYSKLTEDNFNETALDDFIRHQEVKECWRQIENELVLVPNYFVEEWDSKKRREIARMILDVIGSGGFAYGAFLDGKVIGYILISNKFFGSDNQYIELIMFHVSEPYRNMGIGKTLFELACGTARETGAKKFYISAHSSKESQAAYRKLGCTEATEINREIAESEPFDIQMEFTL